jgi:hypothetical protein
MSTEKLKQIMEKMEPREASSSLALVPKDLFMLIVGGGPAGLSVKEKYAKQIVVASADGCSASLAAVYRVETKGAVEEECAISQDMA